MSPELEAEQTVVSILPNVSNKAVKQVTNAYASFGVTVESQDTLQSQLQNILITKQDNSQ